MEESFWRKSAQFPFRAGKAFASTTRHGREDVFTVDVTFSSAPGITTAFGQISPHRKQRRCRCLGIL
jgi:hypothetical protein